MRLRPYRIPCQIILAGLLCWVAPALRAEVSVVIRNADGGVGSLIVSPASISEDADPIPQVDIRWQLYRSVPQTVALNLTGDDRQDGPPDVVYHPSTNRPMVAWAYENGPDHDIAFSEWTGNSWSSESFLTSLTDDELDPRLFVGNDETVFIVWWVDGADTRVMMTSRSVDDTGWTVPVRVSPPGEVVRRPTVAVFEGEVWVAYERERAGSMELAVRRLEPNASFVEEHVISVSRLQRLDPVLHVGSGRLWMDWKHSNVQFGCAEYVDANWNSPTLYDWLDSSWVGVEGTRRLIRSHLLSTLSTSDLGP